MRQEELQCSEGIVLRAVSFRDYDQILTLFTPDQGILKLFYKGSKKKRHVQGLCAPLTRIEVTYKEKNSDLFACENLILLQSYLTLRKHLSVLQAACDLLLALQQSQVEGKEAPQLYHLLIFYLDKISTVADPWTLASSFRLKILKAEGLLTTHFFAESIQFEPNEQQLLELLAFCQSYHQIAQVALPSGFASKINNLFNQEIQR